jgi:hypothetical protein
MQVFTTDDDSGLFVGSVDMEDDDDDGDELGGIGDDAMMGPMAFEDVSGDNQCLLLVIMNVPRPIYCTPEVVNLLFMGMLCR